MANDLSPELLEQLYAQNSGDPLLTLFTLTHPSFPAPVRLVNNNDNVISRGMTFSKFPVELILPADDGETDRTVSVTFDNVSRELVEGIRTVTTPIQVTLELILASIPDEVQMAFEELKLVHVSYNVQKISGRLISDDFLNAVMTSEKYVPTNYPGLF